MTRERRAILTNEILEREKLLVNDLTESERYRYFLSRMVFIRYESGKENLLGSDCSGSVCLALLLATGYAIRVTAEDLLKKYFTVRNPGKEEVKAVFFITLYDRNLGGRVYKAGSACHVCGVCGDNVVLNCVEPVAILRSLSDMTEVYGRMGYKCEIRGLDRMKLKEACEGRRDLFGPDMEFEGYRKIINRDR